MGEDHSSGVAPDFDSFRNGCDAFPDELDKADTLLHRKFKDFSNGDLLHGR